MRDRLKAAVAVVGDAGPSDEGPEVYESRKVLAERLFGMADLLVTVLSYVSAPFVRPSGSGELDFDSASRLVAAMDEVIDHLPELFRAVEGLGRSR